MFWRSAGFSQPSPIEGILERDEFSLEEILDEDDVIQECKSLNTRLIVFLREKQIVEKLIRYLVEPPPEDADVKRRYKYPYYACEIFTCEIDGIFTTVFENPELLDLLFSLLERPSPLPPVLAGYFAKVVSSLLTRRTADCMLFLQDRQHLFDHLVKHLGTTSVAEVVMQLVGADEQILTFHADSLQWLGDTQLLELILESLAAEHSSAVHANAAEVLTAIARTLPSSLANQLGSPIYLQRLFQHTQAPGFGCQGLVLDVCMALLDPNRVAMFARAGFMETQEPVGPPPLLIECCLGQLDTLVPQLKVLAVPDDEEEKVQPTTYGELAPPLGTLRLKIVEFLSVLVRAVVTTQPALTEPLQVELLRLDALYSCLNLFFEYPFHSLLHNYVDALLMAVLESGTEPLLVHLVEHCKLLTALASAPQAIKPRGGKHEVRCGNLGHISRLGNKIVELAASGEGAIAEMCAGHEGWLDWVDAGLSERNAVENLTSWQCGRPRELDDSANDSDGDDDVLRGGGFGMGGGFGSGSGKLGWDNSAWRMETDESSDAYHRYSGDDKEEEGEEEEEGDIDSMKVHASFNFGGSTGLVSLQRHEEDGGSSSDDSVEGASTTVVELTLPLGAAGAPADAEEDAVLIDTDEDDDDMDNEGAASTVHLLAAQLAAKATLEPSPEEQEVATEFNHFNYWKSSYTMEVPDDI